MEQSARDNGVADIVHTAAWDWLTPPPEMEVAERAPFDVCLMPDVMYDTDAVERLVARLREQRPELDAGAEQVGEALRALEAEESEATAAAAPAAADEGASN